MALVYTFLIVVLTPLALGLMVIIGGNLLGYPPKEDNTTTQMGTFFFMLFFFLFIIMGLIVTPSVFISQHMDSINLPQEYITTTQAIEEAKQMIIAYEDDKVNPNLNLSNMNFGQLGKGLEAMELKQRLVNLVEERAELKRKIRYKNRSPWVFFKPKSLSEIKVGT